MNGKATIDCECDAKVTMFVKFEYMTLPEMANEDAKITHVYYRKIFSKESIRIGRL